MASHHFIGTGTLSWGLRQLAGEPEALLDHVGRMVADAGLEVVARHFAAFDNGGLTLVWILAESHLVLHVWGGEGFATVDLHVCDYREENRSSARRLARALDGFCFEPAAASWRSLKVETPLPVPG